MALHEPTHDIGTRRGEDEIKPRLGGGGRAAGVSGAGRPARQATPRDATGINPEKRRPMHPDSVFISPP